MQTINCENFISLCNQEGYKKIYRSHTAHITSSEQFFKIITAVIKQNLEELSLFLESHKKTLITNDLYQGIRRDLEAQIVDTRKEIDAIRKSKTTFYCKSLIKVIFIHLSISTIKIFADKNLSDMNNPSSPNNCSSVAYLLPSLAVVLYERYFLLDYFENKTRKKEIFLNKLKESLIDLKKEERNIKISLPGLKIPFFSANQPTSNQAHETTHRKPAFSNS